MTEINTSATQNARIKQYRNTIIAAFIIVGAFIGILYMTNDSPSDEISTKNISKSDFVSPVDKIDVQSVWTERLQTKLKEQEDKTDALNKEVSDLKNTDSQKSVEDDPKYQALLKQNQLLEDSLSSKGVSQPSKNGAYGGQIFSPMVGGSQNGDSQNEAIPQAAGIDADDLNLTSTSNQPLKTPDTYVPAGTFVQAIMLGAADASAGVESQANPSPMLFRLVADGTLPNKKSSHLKDCVVTAAVIGDISSERGQIRLERMSCTYPNGEIVEQAVEGTIFGMDAKNGVRGTPVWREGALLGRAAMAGALSGFGSAISQSYTTSSISPLGTTDTVNSGQIAKYGMAQGVSNAMDKLADYNIRRAEQYHPVIQLTAGQPVDLVFLKGFFLDGRTHDESNDSDKRPTQLFSSETSAQSGQADGLTISESELAKINQHEQSLKSGGM